jgi:hypothetical protein
MVSSHHACSYKVGAEQCTNKHLAAIKKASRIEWGHSEASEKESITWGHPQSPAMLVRLIMRWRHTSSWGVGVLRTGAGPGAVGSMSTPSEPACSTQPATSRLSPAPVGSGGRGVCCT